MKSLLWKLFTTFTSVIQTRRKTMQYSPGDAEFLCEACTIWINLMQFVLGSFSNVFLLINVCSSTLNVGKIKNKRVLNRKAGNSRLLLYQWCAEPPSPVRDLVMTYRDYSSVRLQWLPPARDGGRSDVRYRVECVGCDEHVAYSPRQSNLHGTASVILLYLHGFVMRLGGIIA